MPMPAVADLNKFEAEMRGEFGIGSAAQFGSADLKFVSIHPFSFLNFPHYNVVYMKMVLCINTWICFWFVLLFVEQEGHPC